MAEGQTIWRGHTKIFVAYLLFKPHVIPIFCPDKNEFGVSFDFKENKQYNLIFFILIKIGLKLNDCHIPGGEGRG